jgi:hypothetical protein
MIAETLFTYHVPLFAQFALFEYSPCLARLGEAPTFRQLGPSPNRKFINSNTKYKQTVRGRSKQRAFELFLSGLSGGISK